MTLDFLADVEGRRQSVNGSSVGVRPVRRGWRLPDAGQAEVVVRRAFDVSVAQLG